MREGWQHPEPPAASTPLMLIIHLNIRQGGAGIFRPQAVIFHGSRVLVLDAATQGCSRGAACLHSIPHVRQSEGKGAGGTLPPSQAGC